VSEDPRGGRVAVVADSLLEARMDELREGNWGVIQLPPSNLDEDAAGEWLMLAAEQVAEYQRTGYEISLVDDGGWRDRLNAALAGLGSKPLS
jgi:hypothetical protein